MPHPGHHERCCGSRFDLLLQILDEEFRIHQPLAIQLIHKGNKRTVIRIQILGGHFAAVGVHAYRFTDAKGVADGQQCAGAVVAVTCQGDAVLAVQLGVFLLKQLECIIQVVRRGN